MKYFFNTFVVTLVLVKLCTLSIAQDLTLITGNEEPTKNSGPYCAIYNLNQRSKEIKEVWRTKEDGADCIQIDFIDCIGELYVIVPKESSATLFSVSIS